MNEKQINDVKVYDEVEEIWEDFCSSIKFENRYFINNSILEILDKILEYCSLSNLRKFTVKRARIGNFLDSNEKELRMPPKGCSKDGRGNPRGISYFYTAAKDDIAIAEVRPHIGDYVTVATFETIDPMYIINFNGINMYEESTKKSIKLTDLQKEFAFIINKKLSIPINEENNLDYIPLQYVIEYIKKKGYDGICYNSSLIEGKNYLFFNDNKFKLINRELYKVDSISIAYSKQSI